MTRRSLENKKEERVEFSLSIKISRHIFDSDAIDNITRRMAEAAKSEKDCAGGELNPL